MSDPYLASFLASFVVWLSVSAWVLADRAAHDRRMSAAIRRFPARRLSWRTLTEVAADPSFEPQLAEAFAHRVLEQHEQRILDAASAKRVTWRSVEAARILARARHPSSLPALEHILLEGDTDVAAAAATILAEMRDEKATSLLISALRTDACPARWVSALLERRRVPVRQLRPLLRDARPGVREAAIRLLARSKRPGSRVEADLIGLCGDPSADVRAAAARALHRRRSTEVVKRLRALLADPVWFVQVQAARSLGRLRMVESTLPIAELLASPQWWVRQAAKEALVEIGLEVRAQLVPFLHHPDPFARNGCAEVLQNLGVVDELVAEAGSQPRGGPTSPAAVLLHEILAAGGSRLEAAVMSRVGPELRDELARLSHVADDGAREARAA